MRYVLNSGLITLLVAALGAAALACGSSEEMTAAAETVVVEREVVREVPVEVEVVKVVEVPGETVVVEKEVVREVPVDLYGESLFGYDPSGIQASLVQQRRIIIRTVDISLKVADVAESIDQVAEVARDFGGWVVDSDRSSTHSGSTSIRVPAQELDNAVVRLRALALEVDTESSTSQDVTDEYVDIQSRLTSLRATEQALLALFERAERVEDALDVQNELARLQAEIEALLGRIKFLEETSAFSLINVSMRLAPVAMSVDAGSERTLSVLEPARFRATFGPPPGIDAFTFVWDFGDGAEPVTGSRTAATTQPGQRVTATVNHTYNSDLDSPYIITFDITGTGEAGIVEGSDTFVVTVKEIPKIEVFLTSTRPVEEGDEIELSGSFTRPVELSNFKYSWEFGDGTPVATGVPGEGVTQLRMRHIFENYREDRYTVTLTVTADSDAGEVSGHAQVGVHVTRSEGLVIGGWSPGNNAKTATRALSGVAQAAGTLVIWLAILSPVWLVISGIIYGIVRLGRRFGSQTPSDQPGQREAREPEGDESAPPAREPDRTGGESENEGSTDGRA